MTTTRTFVIVGAALAGAKAAAELREQGFDGRLLLIGDEAELPYERPPLTKDYLRGESPREKAQVHPESFYADQAIELMRGRSVTTLDAAGHRITLDDGDELPYDRLLLATGAAPRPIELPGAQLDGVRYLRTLADCDDLRARLRDGLPVVVIGAGWIGCEFAASARQLGAEVTMIAPEAVPLERVLGPELGAIYRDVHREHGVELLLGTGVEAFEGASRLERVRVSDGRVVDCGLALVGIGASPRTGLAAAAGLDVDDGILVDASLATSAPDVFAAGDVANAWHPVYERRVRVEHWANALHQGPAAAQSMLGRRVSYDRIPYFYSDQYDVGMEYSGLARSSDELVFRGDPQGREFVAFWLADGVVVAGMNVNVWDVNEHVQALIRAGTPVDVQLLTDPDTPLAQLAADAGS
jgi:3-phenylpropionate/trans-cinnamate dioxygenase ferredoxin reductase component